MNETTRLFTRPKVNMIYRNIKSKYALSLTKFIYYSILLMLQIISLTL